jgi:hypothetical protein
MRRVATTLVLALSLIGCGSAQPSLDFHQDLNDNKNCAPEKFLVGQLTESLALQTDEEGLRSLIWPSSYKLRWSPGVLTGHFEVLDDSGSVVAITGRRYRIGGSEFVAAGNAFWVCGGLTPQ